MKLFFDEDIGKSIPRALRSVKVPYVERIEYPRAHESSPVRSGTKDKDWIPWAGDNEFVVISHNHRMLENPIEIALLVRHRVGIVFARDAEARTYEILRMLLDRWDWLEQTARTQQRPFCAMLRLRGAPTIYDTREIVRFDSAGRPMFA